MALRPEAVNERGEDSAWVFWIEVWGDIFIFSEGTADMALVGRHPRLKFLCIVMVNAGDDDGGISRRDDDGRERPL